MKTVNRYLKIELETSNYQSTMSCCFKPMFVLLLCCLVMCSDINEKDEGKSSKTCFSGNKEVQNQIKRVDE